MPVESIGALNVRTHGEPRWVIFKRLETTLKMSSSLMGCLCGLPLCQSPGSPELRFQFETESYLLMKYAPYLKRLARI